jgi:excisionase family DNA binding protein
MYSEAEKRGNALRQLKELGRCSIPNACVLMQLHHHTLRKYVEEGAIKALMIGKRPWIEKDEIDRYQREGKRTINPFPASPGIEANYGGGEPTCSNS